MSDPILARIQENLHSREALTALWPDLTDPLHRCALAHVLADLQAAPRDELLWDTRALEAARELTDDRLQPLGIPLAAFFPSLHLNLGECHRKLGQLAEAREHLAEAQERLPALPEDGYGTMIRRGVEGLAERLAGMT